jgi:hypothetical protein
MCLLRVAPPIIFPKVLAMAHAQHVRLQAETDPLIRAFEEASDALKEGDWCLKSYLTLRSVMFSRLRRANVLAQHRANFKEIAHFSLWINWNWTQSAASVLSSIRASKLPNKRAVAASARPWLVMQRCAGPAHPDAFPKCFELLRASRIPPPSQPNKPCALWRVRFASSRILLHAVGPFFHWVAALTLLQLDAAIHRREAAETQSSDFLDRVKARVALPFSCAFKCLVTVSQIVEEEKLQLEAIINQQRREDRFFLQTSCFIPAIVHANNANLRTVSFCSFSDLRSSIQNIRDALDARHRVLFASILSRC